MRYGLSEKIINQIENIVKKYDKYDFKIFGSRARGDYKKTSDIDIAIFKDVDRKDEYRIRDEFDKIDIIYKIDLVFITDKIEKEFLNSIKKDGVDF